MSTEFEATSKRGPSGLFIGGLVLTGVILVVVGHFVRQLLQPSDLYDHGLSEQIKTLESQAELPFDFVGLDIRGSEQNGPVEQTLDFVVTGKYRDTIYYEIDPQKIARQDDYIRQSLNRPLEELKQAASAWIHWLAITIRPPTSM